MDLGKNPTRQKDQKITYNWPRQLEKTELYLLIRMTKIGQSDELFIRNKIISIFSKVK